MQAPTPQLPAEPRQRWRIAYGRSPDAPELAQREQLAAWEASLAATGLPIVGLDLQPSRPRIVFAAPLGVGMPAEHELADLFLTERRPAAEVREALVRHLPAGYLLSDIHDVWLGAPALPGQVIAADYRARISGDPGSTIDPEVLVDAARGLMQAAALPRTRDKGGRAVSYDLRPLVADVAVEFTTHPDQPGGTAILRIRVRFDPERGVGRPDEVLAVLSESSGIPLSFVSLVRERVVLATDLQPDNVLPGSGSI